MQHNDDNRWQDQKWKYFFYCYGYQLRKVRLHVTPEILLEQFKTPITEKFKLAKSMLKSNVLVVYCVTDNQVTKFEKID